MNSRSRTTRARLLVVLATATLVAVGGTTAAYSAGLIGSDDIKDNSVQSGDIKNKTLKMQDLTAKLKSKVNATTPGPKGSAGPAGPTGPQGPAGPAGKDGIVRVTDLNGAWKARATDAAGVKMTGDGIAFGPFVNGGGCSTPGVDFGRLDYSGMNGQALSSLKSLVYHARYTATNDTGGVGSPTMRVFFGTGDDRLTFSPNTQPDGDFEEGPMHEWIVTSGTVRLNDDAGSNPGAEAPWSTFMAAHGSKPISNINILNGCQAGVNLASLVRRIEINGTTFAFGS